MRMRDVAVEIDRIDAHLVPRPTVIVTSIAAPTVSPTDNVASVLLRIVCTSSAPRPPRSRGWSQTSATVEPQSEDRR